MFQRSDVRADETLKRGIRRRYFVSPGFCVSQLRKPRCKGLNRLGLQLRHEFQIFDDL